MSDNKDENFRKVNMVLEVSVRVQICPHPSHETYHHSITPTFVPTAFIPLTIILRLLKNYDSHTSNHEDHTFPIPCTGSHCQLRCHQPRDQSHSS
jgi:hypothetical protein